MSSVTSLEHYRRERQASDAIESMGQHAFKNLMVRTLEEGRLSMLEDASLTPEQKLVIDVAIENSINEIWDMGIDDGTDDTH